MGKWMEREKERGRERHTSSEKLRGREQKREKRGKIGSIK